MSLLLKSKAIGGLISVPCTRLHHSISYSPQKRCFGCYPLSIHEMNTSMAILSCACSEFESGWLYSPSKRTKAVLHVSDGWHCKSLWSTEQCRITFIDLTLGYNTGSVDESYYPSAGRMNDCEVASNKQLNPPPWMLWQTPCTSEEGQGWPLGTQICNPCPWQRTIVCNRHLPSAKEVWGAPRQGML